VVFVGDGSAKQRHNAIAEHLIDGALDAVHGVHHQLEGRIEELAARLPDRDRESARCNPFRSANSTVTCLRSPSSALRDVRIFSAR